MNHSCQRPSYWRVFLGNFAGAATIGAGTLVGFVGASALEGRSSTPQRLGVVVAGAVAGLAVSPLVERAILKSPGCKNPSYGRVLLSNLVEIGAGLLTVTLASQVDQTVLPKVTSIGNLFLLPAVSQKVLRA